MQLIHNELITAEQETEIERQLNLSTEQMLSETENFASSEIPDDPEEIKGMTAEQMLEELEKEIEANEPPEDFDKDDESEEEPY